MEYLALVFLSMRSPKRFGHNRSRTIDIAEIVF
jgi:hypothetical protein